MGLILWANVMVVSGLFWFSVLWRQFQCLTVSAIKLMRSDQPVQPANRPSLAVEEAQPSNVTAIVALINPCDSAAPHPPFGQ